MKRRSAAKDPANPPQPSSSPGEESIGKWLNTWLQNVGIVIAAIWALWTFYFKDFVIPRSAPVNITLELEIKRAGSAEPKQELTALEVKASASNPASRAVYLLPSAWIAHGITISQENDEARFKKIAREVLLDAKNTRSVLKHAQTRTAPIIGTGHLFGDTILKPGEKLNRTLLIYVPSGIYDAVDISAFTPTTADAKQIRLDWRIEDNQLQPRLCCIQRNGTCSPIPKNDEEYELQTAVATTEISLWNSQEK